LDRRIQRLQEAAAVSRARVMPAAAASRAPFAPVVHYLGEEMVEGFGRLPTPRALMQ